MLCPGPLPHVCSFKVYDADAYAPCRYHLLRRAKRQEALQSSGDESNGTAAATATFPLPGAALRWRMQADATGLAHHGHMVHRVHNMYQVYTLYYLLQVLGRRVGELDRGQAFDRKVQLLLHLPVQVQSAHYINNVK